MNMMIENSMYRSTLSLQTTSATTSNGSAFAATMEMVLEVAATETPASQTVDDVKKEFYAYLDSLPISPGLARTPLSVNITEAAFEKMLADPEYKQKMKDLCARDLCDPAWSKMPPSAINVTIDADCEEEYLATSYNSPDGGKNANPDGFWTRRTKSKEDQKILDKKAQEKREMLELLQEKADERKRIASEWRGAGVFVSGTDAGGVDAGDTASLF